MEALVFQHVSGTSYWNGEVFKSVMLCEDGRMAGDADVDVIRARLLGLLARRDA